MKNKSAVILGIIIFLSLFLRLYKLADIPRGFYIDEASLGYNAYSFLLTGKDEFGKAFPVFLRSFGVYAAPLYTYFLVPLVKAFGLTVFVNRSLCAVSGVIIVLLTFVFVRKLLPRSPGFAFLSALLVSISPWSVFFSRGTFEANLALLLMIAGLLGLHQSVKKPVWLPVSAFVLALSVYAYQGPRLVSSLLLLGFLILRRRIFLHRLRDVFLAITIFVLTISPQLMLLGTPGALTRLTGQTYPGNRGFVWEFTSQYVAYFSPGNLFYYPDFDLQRSLPDLSVFYAWMGIPLAFGIAGVIRNRKNPWVQSLLLLLVLSPIPAALVRDPFAVWRTLPSLWVLTVIIAWGSFDILKLVTNRYLRVSLAVGILILSLARLYSSAFVLLPVERAAAWGDGFRQLAEKLREYRSENIFIDQGRIPPAYIELAFFGKIPPQKLQEQTPPEVVKNYYGVTDFPGVYTLDNITTGKLVYSRDVYLPQIIVGDSLLFSEEKSVKEHYLTPIFTIYDPRGNVLFHGFRTNPRAKCLSTPNWQKLPQCNLLDNPDL